MPISMPISMPGRSLPPVAAATPDTGFTPSDWIALIAVIAGIAGVVVNNVVGIWARSRERKDDRRHAISKEALAVAGPLQAFVLDITVERITMWGLTSDTYMERFNEIDERWQPIREGLVGVEVSHHDEKVRLLSRELAVAVHNTIHATGLFARDLLQPIGGGDHDWFADARAAYTEAATKLDAWLSALRG